MSILSAREDGLGFFYADFMGRTINVRKEPHRCNMWCAYIGGDPIGYYPTKDEAEQAAISWAKANPETREGGG